MFHTIIYFSLNIYLQQSLTGVLSHGSSQGHIFGGGGSLQHSRHLLHLSTNTYGGRGGLIHGVTLTGGGGGGGHGFLCLGGGGGGSTYGVHGFLQPGFNSIHGG